MAAVSQVFTDYVRALDPAGEPPDAAAFDRVWGALRRSLARELQRRGLWDVSPDYLGVYGGREWQGGGGAADDALEELLADCYTHVFVRRLGGLKAQLQLKPTIEGLVLVAIRNFLHDLQKKHDPLGFRVFEILRSAVRRALDGGGLAIVSGDPRIRNDSVLGFTEPAAGSLPPLADDEELGPRVAAWNDLLLPDLITARGAARQRVIAVLESLLLRLPADGVEAVSFKQLIDPLKNDARGRWGALLESTQAEPAIEVGDGGLLTPIRRSPPDSAVEERDVFDKLVVCVEESVDRWQEPGRVRDYLSTLWEFFRTQPRETETDGRLSARQLSGLLRIPRDRLPTLMKALQQLVESCRAASSEEPPVNPSREAGEP